MVSARHRLVATAYILGLLTSTFWYWSLFIVFPSSITKVDVLSITTNRSPSFERKQVTQSMLSKMSYERQNNIIMSAAINMDLSSLHRFTRSARASCNSCTIVLFVNNNSANNDDTRLLADAFKVAFIDEAIFLPKHNEKAFHSIGVWHKRWIIFYDYLQTLKETGKVFDNVFLCDCRDTVFQTNVFAHMNTLGDGLYVIIEDVNFTIGKSQVNGEWVKACYDDRVYQAMSNKSISCSGTVLGSWAAIITYLSSMKSQIVTRPNACIQFTGSDQGIHNFIVHNAIVPNTTVYHISHETGFVGTLALPSWIKRNKVGLVLNANKDIYAVVHQIDRSPQLLWQYQREYQLLPDDVLNKKA